MEKPPLGDLPALAGRALFGVVDEVDAAKEFAKAGAGDLVIDADAPFFGLEQSCPLHDGEVLGKCRHIASCECREFIHAFLAMSQSLHDEQARGMSHCLHHACPELGVLFERLQRRSHIW